MGQCVEAIKQMMTPVLGNPQPDEEEDRDTPRGRREAG